MAIEQTTPQVLQLANACQYLQVVAIGQNEALKGGDIDQRIARLIYMERKSIQNRYNINPTDPTLVATTTYLYSILRGVAIGQRVINGSIGSKPIITGPANQSGNVGFNAVFSVFVVSATPVTFQWFRNSVLIPGATSISYTLSNAQLTDSGATFFVVATNSSGQTVSSTANLTVTNSITGYLYYTATDPGPTLLANSDPFAYQSNFPITHNSPIAVPLSVAASNNQYDVIKIPSGEPLKTTYFNTVTNQGTIPPPADFIMATPVSFGGFTYYYTKTTASWDSTQPLTLN